MLIILLSASLLVWIAVLIDAVLGLKSLDRLEDSNTMTEGPLLSVITAARNEEAKLAESLETQLRQSYKRIEWILVNDRSADSTGSIMDHIQNNDSRVKCIHIDSLPCGWLGKNHALYKGYMESSGELILFTDADVLFKEEAFSKAVHYFSKNELDHLTAAPRLTGRSFWLNTFIAFFLFGFSYYKRPWLANNQRSKSGVGIGAFNMVSRRSYEAIGTHKAIKMRPDDDLMLGMKIKQNGLRQKFATAMDLIEVEWYESLIEAFKGLEKNTFAGLHYRISMVLFAIAGTFSSQVLPFLTIFSTDKVIFNLSLANIIFLAGVYTIITKRMTNFSPLLFTVFPITALLFIYSIIRASILTFVRGGIVWRGTLYKLSELRNKH
ncbi:glycosyl transferase [Cytobacillus firmus]|uniref:glycosyltransferase n=1 Tax=Cytobacillus firmus TaxID=1399 RepID=UPI0018CDEFBD|nr:glycosyltransferase family 2 protein [Cytobacillus firmus]MBG9448745.1 glycosyl transferase [Cytobacillus firmus]